MSAEIKLKMTEEVAPPPLPSVLPPPVPQSVTAKTTGQVDDDAKSDESIVKGIIGGTMAAVVVAIIWAAISYASGWQIGWMAVGVGALVGFAVRWLGQGTSAKFGCVGAGFSLFGCLLGNFLMYTVIEARSGEGSWISALLATLKEPAVILDLMYAGWHPMDFLFYVIALFEGWRFSYSNVAGEY